ncbi:MAG: nitroreductase [Clostridia bacterium]|nr:nitroreductase [Clostridia bacterium]
MNETIKNLTERRSCRSYSDRPVGEETLLEILKAGTFAPTGRNRQSPVIVAVEDKETRDLLSKMNREIMGSDTDPFYGAPVVLVVLADPKVPTYLYDGSLVMGNLLNAAHALGVDSCWIHRAREEFDSPEGRALLEKWGLPAGLEGIGHCILGYRKEDLPPASARKEGYIVRVKA